MVCRVQRNPMDLHRKLQVLRDLTGSKSVRKRCIIMDAFDYIKQLKLKVEALNNEYLALINNRSSIQFPTDGMKQEEVKVEKMKENCFVVRVSWEKARDLLVPILEGFEEKGLNVVHVRVCSNQSTFCMEAITQTHQNTTTTTTLDVGDVTQSVLKALKTKIGDKNISY